MGNRVFNIAAALSAVAVCLVTVALFAAHDVDPRRQFVSLSKTCHLTLYGHDAGGRLWMFNDSSYGPYMGSIIGVAGDPNWPKASGVGDVAGVYYRMIRWPNGTALWTLSFSLWYPLLLALPIPILWLIRRSRSPHCGFAVDDRPRAA